MDVTVMEGLKYVLSIYNIIVKSISIQNKLISTRPNQVPLRHAKYQTS